MQRKTPMQPAFDLRLSLEFLSGLRFNNNRQWFSEHRGEYEQAREQFALFLDALAAEVSKFDDLQGSRPRDHIMRIYRDVRFSADKSPYRPNFGASFGPPTHFSYYIHLEPFRASMIAGGMYMPGPAQLARFRREVARDAGRLREVAQHPDFIQYFGGLGGEKLKTAPREYARDHPEIELLRFKQVLAVYSIQDGDLVAPDFLPEAVAACRALKPFLEVMQEMAGPEEFGSRSGERG
jgi:uncharacterized protein (TIGR02453 family)